MPKKTRTDQKRRLLTLLDALPLEGRHGIGPRELAQRMASAFGVEDYVDPPGCAPGTGEKRLQRDLRSLEELFGAACVIKDDSYRNRPLYWKSATAKLPGLDAHTALALKLAGAALRPLLPPPTFARLEEYFAAGELALQHLTRAADWQNKVRVLPRGQPLQPPIINPVIQQTVQNALFENRQLRLRYRKKWDQRAQIYDGLHPAGLIMRGALIYLVAFKAGDDTARQFAMHRIQEAKLLAGRSRVPGGFNLEHYVVDGAPGLRLQEECIRLELRMDAVAAEHLNETALSADQVVHAEDGGSILVSASLPWTKELEWWVLGLGDQVEVVAPLALRESIAGRLRRAAALYHS